MEESAIDPTPAEPHGKKLPRSGKVSQIASRCGGLSARNDDRRGVRARPRVRFTPQRPTFVRNIPRQPRGGRPAIRWPGAPDTAVFPFHPDQIIEEHRDSSLTVRFKAGGCDVMCWHLFTWGESVTVDKAARPRWRLAEMRALLTAHHGGTTGEADSGREPNSHGHRSGGIGPARTPCQAGTDALGPTTTKLA